MIGGETVQTARLRLERAFERVLRERMADMPFVNGCLAVRAVGLRPYEDWVLGVLITPWCMNLVLLPYRQEITGCCGQSRVQTFPSGRYEFIVGEQEEIGRYLMCSLFSPMFEFGDQGSAEATARAVLDRLLEPGPVEHDDSRAGGGPPTAASAAAAAPAIDRREALRRLFATGGARS